MTDKELERQRKYRSSTGNASTKRYEKTKKGFLMRTYRNMESRITGIQSKKAHLYKGKSLLSREEFYNFSINDKDFHTLFDAWEIANYDRKLTPSIDRPKAEECYYLGNMRWITHSHNSRNGTISRGIKNGWKMSKTSVIV